MHAPHTLCQSGSGNCPARSRNGQSPGGDVRPFPFSQFEQKARPGARTRYPISVRSPRRSAPPRPTAFESGPPIAGEEEGAALVYR